VATDLAPTDERLAKLIRMLGSDRDGEVVATVVALKRALAANGLDLHDLADRLTRQNKSEPDVAALLQARREGFRQGYRAAQEDFDTSDTLTWREVAEFCAARSDLLQPYEAKFVRQMEAWTARGRTPSEKQGRWLDLIYSRLNRTRRK
jgi:hypothetical protein